MSIRTTKKSQNMQSLIAAFQQSSEGAEIVSEKNENLSSLSLEKNTSEVVFDEADEAIQKATSKLLAMTGTPGDFVGFEEDSNYTDDGNLNVCSRKSSYSSLHNGQNGTLNQQNRRCSSGSNGPSSSNIYATIQNQQQNGVYNGGQPQTQQQPQMNGGPTRVPVPPPPPSNGIAPISNKAPPPPPPPPDLSKMPPPSKGLSLADQLKNASLKKTSGPPQTNGIGTVLPPNKTNGEAPPTPQQKSSGPDFFSELAAKIESRNTSKNCKADTVSTSSSSGVSSSSVGATASDTSDSGATLTTRKPNGDAPVNSGTTKPWQKPNGILTAGITAAVQNNGIESPKVQRKTSGEPSSPTITSADLNQFKQEILAEMKLEIARAKQEILDAIRNEFAR
ncbi:hypothetical protein FO519_000042 [Halicephalobus sp. NKZ332]|nr:hypothetical protein FO519_000042 [Halicephalobus sp. NKZ332]